jgi:DNA-binding MarR family transcriptional regulator
MSRVASPAAASNGRDWTFFSNHAHVLIALATDPEPRLRDVAERVGITERAVHKILADLEAQGLVARERDGRNNRYTLHLDQPLRHALEAHRSVAALVEFVTGKPSRPKTTRTKKAP